MRARPMLLFFTLLQLADIATTNRALALPGNAEVNPVMSSAMAHLGPAWWLPKLVVLGLIFVATRYAHDSRSKLLISALYAAVAMTFLVVANNLTRL
ncbi:MAG TPA: DUF5658 family protein [Alphaproteobacteria bacterium]|nr:DUF5658 family protein [Alphaproteobacteria bacterium]